MIKWGYRYDVLQLSATNVVVFVMLFLEYLWYMYAA